MTLSSLHFMYATGYRSLDHFHQQWKKRPGKTLVERGAGADSDCEGVVETKYQPVTAAPLPIPLCHSGGGCRRGWMRGW